MVNRTIPTMHDLDLLAEDIAQTWVNGRRKEALLKLLADDRPSITTALAMAVATKLPATDAATLQGFVLSTTTVEKAEDIFYGS